MIDSLFIINRTGTLILEKHWKSVISHSICDYFYLALKEAPCPEDVAVAITTPQHYMINVYRNQLFFVAVTKAEMPPMFVVELLHQFVDALGSYFEDCNESTVKDNAVTIYELLDEILDDGYPLNTEPNVLHELIRPQNFFRNLSNTVTGKSNIGENLPLCQLSNIPWRRSDVRYANNEAYFDVVEEIDAIVDKNGMSALIEVNGFLDCCIKLSGMPDLTMAFANPRIFEDVSFHNCVRFKRWEMDRVLSFVPPDGRFRLMSFRISTQRLNLPISVRQTFAFKSTESGRLEIVLTVPSILGKTLEEVKLSIVMPKYVVGCNFPPSTGKCTFDAISKTLLWQVGKVDSGTSATLKGNVSVQPSAELTSESPVTNIQFIISQVSLSGIKISRLDVHGERYRPFKGVKYITRAGNYQIRG